MLASTVGAPRRSEARVIQSSLGTPADSKIKKRRLYIEECHSDQLRPRVGGQRHLWWNRSTLQRSPPSTGCRVQLSILVSSWGKEEDCCSGHTAASPDNRSCGEHNNVHDLSSHITKDISWTNDPRALTRNPSRDCPPFSSSAGAPTLNMLSFFYGAVFPLLVDV